MATVKKSTTQSATAPAAKSAPAAKAVRTTKAPRAAKSGAASEPSMRFYHSHALRQKTVDVLDALDAHPGRKNHGEEMADLVSDLIDAGMNHFFLKPLEAADMGFIAEQSARLGISGAVKLMNSVSRKFLTRMEHGQLIVVSTHIRSLALA